MDKELMKKYKEAEKAFGDIVDDIYKCIRQKSTNLSELEKGIREFWKQTSWTGGATASYIRDELEKKYKAERNAALDKIGLLSDDEMG